MSQRPASKRVPRPRVLTWARRYLPEYFTNAPARFHAELFADLTRREARLIARVAPRGHAKSTCVAFAFPLWMLCEQRAKNILIITHERTLATQFLRDIRTELETNERIRTHYGDLCAPPENAKTAANDASDATHQKKTTRARKPRVSQSVLTTNTGVTVQAKGAGAALRGVRVGPHRPDLIICDDIEKDELVASAEGRRKLEYWLRRVVMPALAPHGMLVVLGSIIHHDSLLANLANKQRWPRWDYRVYRAIEAEADAEGVYRRIALWPTRWPLDRLDAERERVGTRAFEQEYMANPIDDEVRVFHETWLKRTQPEDLEQPHLIPLMAVDPATGSAGGDWSAFWTGAIDPRSGVIHTRQLLLERIGIVEQVRRVMQLFEQTRPVRIGIETVAYQVALQQILEEESRTRGLYMPITSLKTLANKRARIEGTAPFFERGLFRLPTVIDAEVLAQFLQFPQHRHDDAPDVCAMAIELARGLRSLGERPGVLGNGDPRAHREQW